MSGIYMQLSLSDKLYLHIVGQKKQTKTKLLFLGFA